MAPNTDAPNADAPDSAENDSAYPKSIHISLCNFNHNHKISHNTKE